MALITERRSIIPACDVRTLAHLDDIIKATAHEPGIGAYKIGLTLEMRFGLPTPVRIIRAHHPDIPIIYDRQKAGNDIPAMGQEFAEAAKEAGVTAVILFPFAGPKTETAWITACQKQELTILVGSHMTHEEFVWEQGGFIPLEQLERVYDIAVDSGVTDFVVPGNHSSIVKKIPGPYQQKDGVRKLRPVCSRIRCPRRHHFRSRSSRRKSMACDRRHGDL